MAVNNDYTYSYLSFFGYQFAKKLMDGFWETAARLGADENPFRAGMAQQICVAETDAQAEKDYLEHVTYFFKKCLHIPGYFFETPGYRTRRSAEFALRTNRPDDIAKMATMEKNWKTLVDHGFIIAGSPETVADRLIDAAKGLRIGNLIALLQIGSMGHELTKKNLTLFAEGVMPKIKDLWADEGWEHRWWPQGARKGVESVAVSPGSSAR
jgi:alkanesulfonate monooxygenase SsuD/methylene tetrahydromethanopterin reductase-like flavin-dependent oxidoreductase (luciferase family)